MNKVVLIGRLTKDPESRVVRSGDKDMTVAKFSVAVNRRGKDAGTDFISCTAFGSTAETICKYFVKGKMIAVCGRIQTGSYTNKEGQKVYTTDVIVDEFDFCESKKDGETQDAPQPTPEMMDIPDGLEDELPFK